MIVSGDNPTIKDHQFILKPVSGRAGLEMDKTGKIDRPKMKARLLFNELGFVLDETQYRDILMLVDLFHFFIRHQEYRKYKPAKSPKEDPKAWLQFAGKAVLDRIHDKTSTGPGLTSRSGGTIGSSTSLCSRRKSRRRN